MRVFSIFAGVGGFELAKPHDWNIIGFSEIDKHASAVLRYHWPEVKNYGDIEKIDYEELPDFDILWGGSPCQDVSMAGKRAGLSGVRSGLFFSYVSLLKVKRPRYFLFENVAGLLSSNQGRDFATVLGEFSAAGYDNIRWQVLDATWFGVPQHRERVFVLGTLGERGFREVLFEAGNGQADHELQGQQANAITRRYRESQATGTYVVDSELAPQEKIENIHFSRRQIDRIYGTGGIAPTLHRATGGRSMAKIGMKEREVAFPVLEPGFKTTRSNGRRVKTDNEPVFTLRTGVRNGVAIPVRDLDRGNYNANGRKVKTDNEPQFTLQSASRHGVYDGMRVRYLTPLECERLMGWPDEYTRYGINDRGEEYELSDHARYNLIGNGVVPQVVKGIIEKLIT